MFPCYSNLKKTFYIYIFIRNQLYLWTVAQKHTESFHLSNLRAFTFVSDDLCKKWCGHVYRSLDGATRPVHPALMRSTPWTPPFELKVGTSTPQSLAGWSPPRGSWATECQPPREEWPLLHTESPFCVFIRVFHFSTRFQTVCVEEKKLCYRYIVDTSCLSERQKWTTQLLYGGLLRRGQKLDAWRKIISKNLSL